MKVKLKNFIEIVENGTRDKGGAVKKGIPSLGAEHLNSNGTINWSIEKMKYISFELFNKMKTGIMKKDDVLIVKDGATTGKVAYVDDIPYNYSAINEHVFLLRPKKELLPKYLFYYLASKEGKQKVLFYFRGATVGGITKDFLNIDIPLTSISEQKKIVNILDKVANLIELRKKQLEKLDIFSKALFVEMFGSLEHNINYPYKKIVEFSNVISGGTPNRKKEDYWLNGTIHWVKTTELKNTKINNSEEKISELGLENSSAKIVPKNTILIAMYGQGKTRGMTALLNIEASTNQACACILPSKNINYMYLWQYMILSYNQLRSMAKGGNQPNLNLDIIKNFKVLTPPIELQNQFAKKVEHIDKIKLSIQDSLTKLETLKKSLMQEYFS